MNVRFCPENIFLLEIVLKMGHSETFSSWCRSVSTIHQSESRSYIINQSVNESKNHLKTHLSQTEWDIYNEWTDYVFENSPELKLDGIIYLRADPTICANRMKKRGRLDESGVTLDYLKGTGLIDSARWCPDFVTLSCVQLDRFRISTSSDDRFRTVFEWWRSEINRWISKSTEIIFSSILFDSTS